MAGTNSTDDLAVPFGAGDGTCGNAVLTSPAGNITDLVSLGLADHNLDGYTDIATSAWAAGTYSITNGAIGGLFNDGATYAIGGNAMYEAVGDVNGDGIPDFFGAQVSNTLAMLFVGAGNSTFRLMGRAEAMNSRGPW